MADLYRYAAFISYSSKDAAFAKRLHRALESYGIPASLGKFDLIGGGKKNRIYPVFRDREELAAGNLGEVIEANLRASAALIVVCSPNAAVSPWVQKEIEYFAGLGRTGKIFAILSGNAPLTDEHGVDATQLCFPPAFRGHALSGHKLEPLAADARSGKDGFRSAWLKIVAALIGVSPGQIVDRDKQARRKRGLMWSAFAAALVVAGSIAFWQQAVSKRQRAIEQAESVSSAVASSVEPGLVFEDQQAVRDSLLGFVGTPGLRALGVYRVDGTFFSGCASDSHGLPQRLRSADGTVFAGDGLGNGTATTTQALHQARTTVGFVVAQVSTGPGPLCKVQN